MTTEKLKVIGFMNPLHFMSAPVIIVLKSPLDERLYVAYPSGEGVKEVDGTVERVRASDAFIPAEKHSSKTVSYEDGQIAYVDSSCKVHITTKEGLISIIENDLQGVHNERHKEMLRDIIKECSG